MWAWIGDPSMANVVVMVETVAVAAVAVRVPVRIAVLSCVFTLAPDEAVAVVVAVVLAGLVAMEAVVAVPPSGLLLFRVPYALIRLVFPSSKVEREAPAYLEVRVVLVGEQDKVARTIVRATGPEALVV